MRKILFRGKTRKYNAWVYGDLSQGAAVTDIAVINDGRPYFVAPDTVGQFTGDIDRNGTWAFEGDVLDVEGGTIIVVTDCQKLHLRPSAFAVIGNVHDNPELFRNAT